MKTLVITASVIASIALFSTAYAETSFQMQGSGAALAAGDNPKIYKSTMSLTLSDPSTVTGGSIRINGSGMEVQAQILPQTWSISYDTGGSFYGKGLIETNTGQILNLSLAGNRIFATGSGSLWRIQADLQGNNGGMVLQYLVTGLDPIPALDVSPTATVIIPNGNSGMGNQSFYLPLNSVVVRGTTVTWINYDNSGHTIQSEDGTGHVIPMFNSGILYTGDSFCYMFLNPGSYYYFDTLNQWRVGAITVI